MDYENEISKAAARIEHIRERLRDEKLEDEEEIELIREQTVKLAYQVGVLEDEVGGILGKTHLK